MIVHNNPYFSVKNKNNYFSIHFNQDQVVILPIVDNKHILFVKTIRPLFDFPLIELPAGGVDNNESKKEAAIRELGEETGIYLNTSDSLKKIKPLNILPSRSNQMLNIFIANLTNREYNNRIEHDNEISDTLLLSFEKTISNINDGNIFIATHIAICLRYLIQNYLMES